jgi:hypothetical protein
MGSRVRQIRQQLGLASAMVLCALLSGTVAGRGVNGLDESPPEPEFRIARLAYNGNSFSGFRGGGRAWQIDAPEAEFYVTQGIRRLTRIDTFDSGERTYADAEDVTVIPTLDDQVFNYPFLYAVEVGNWYLDDEEAKWLREYLDRGGFMIVDDFHGNDQWEAFYESFQRVFPDKELREIDPDHEVFHVLFDLTQKVRDKTQIYGKVLLGSGVTCEECWNGGDVPHWRGVFDDNGRLMMVVNFNMDLGDSWEEANTPGYPQPLTALGYRFAISYALYAMTH